MHSAYILRERPSPHSARSSASSKFDWLCCLSYSLLCIAWSAWAGKDQNWDLINYHVYAALAWWENRLPDELFAASFQGYLNPLAHLPFFAALSMGWHSLAIGTLMAGIHSINLWLLHFIAAEVISGTDRLKRLGVIASVLIGALAPAFLIEVGTSFTDVIVSVPALAAFLCALRWAKTTPQQNNGKKKYAALVGLFSGITTALKLTSAVFATALVISMVVARRKVSTGDAGRIIAGGIVGLLIAGGSQAWMLWKSFSNPFFPLFNDVFHSPWFDSVALICERFRPTSLKQALSYPFDLIDPFRRPGLELISVDVRPVWILVLCLIITIHHLGLRKGTGSRVDFTPPTVKLFFITLSLFFPMWLYTSGIIRYGVQGFLTLGPAIVWCALKLQTQRTALFTLLAIGLPLAAQSIASITLNPPRWSPYAWTKSWFVTDIPKRLASTPIYFLSMQTQTYAALAAFVHPNSRFTNLIGQTTLRPDSPLWHSVLAYQQSRHLPLRTLYAIPLISTEGGVPLSNLDSQDNLLSEYDMKVDRADCDWLTIDADENAPPPHWERVGKSSVYSTPNHTILLSCAITESKPLPTKELEHRAAIDTRMQQWEQRCPSVFSPSHTQSQQRNGYRQRHYVNTDMQIVEASGKLFSRSAFYNLDMLQIEDANGRSQIKGCPPRTSGSGFHD